MDFFQVDLGLPHQGTRDPNPACHACRANKTTRSWFNFSEAAPWRSDLPRNPASHHTVNKIIAFSPDHYLFDWLHVVDLGVASEACGSILYDIIYNKLSHETKPKALSRVLSEIQNHPSNHGNPIARLELKNITKPSRHLKQFPSLTYLKAAEVRNIIPGV
jgi:hypothetical protein